MRKKNLLVLFLASLSLMPASGQKSVANALSETEQDLTKARQELTTVREQISLEKPEKSRAFDQSELELLEKRRLVRIARMSRQDRDLAEREFSQQQALLTQDANYLSGLLKDHALRIDTLARPGQPTLGLPENSLQALPDDPATTLENRLAVIEASVARLETLLGGTIGEGQVVDDDGTVHVGQIASLGPESWFTNNQTQGSVVQTQGLVRPRLIPAKNPDLAPLFAGEELTLPIDVTGGKARALADLTGGPWDLIRKGGLWVWPIMILALLATICGIIKLLAIMKIREPLDSLIPALLAAENQNDDEKVHSLLDSIKHPAQKVLTQLSTHPRQSVDLLEDLLYEQLTTIRARATSLLPVLSVTAATAPLLGLLGTVSGMIRTFNLITLFGSGDPKPLAGGIGEALITTLFGLAVAIPILILHAFLSRKAKGIVQTSERLGLAYLNAKKLA